MLLSLLLLLPFYNDDDVMISYVGMRDEAINNRSEGASYRKSVSRESSNGCSDARGNYHDARVRPPPDLERQKRQDITHTKRARAGVRASTHGCWCCSR